MTSLPRSVSFERSLRLLLNVFIGWFFTRVYSIRSSSTARSQFAHRPTLDLSDPLFGYAHRNSNLLQGQRFLATSEAKTTRDNLPLPCVESIEGPYHLRLSMDLSRLLLVTVRPRSSSTVLNISEWLLQKRPR